MAQLNVRVDDGTRDLARREATKRNLSLGQLVTTAIRLVAQEGLPSERAEEARYEDLERRLSRLEELANL